MKKTLVLFSLISFSVLAQTEGGSPLTVVSEGAPMTFGNAPSGGLGMKPLKCPKDKDSWEALKDEVVKQGPAFGYSYKLEGEDSTDQSVISSGNPGMRLINHCIKADTSLKEEEQQQLKKCFSQVLDNQPIDPLRVSQYYTNNRFLFEKDPGPFEAPKPAPIASGFGIGGITEMVKDVPLVKFKDEILNDPQIYKGIDKAETREKTIADLRKKVKKLGGDVFYSNSNIGAGIFGRVQVFIPGKDGCDRHYSIQTAPVGDKTQPINTNSNLPVAIICHKDPFTGKKLAKPSGHLLFYSRNFDQPGKPADPFSMGGPVPKGEGIFPSAGFGTIHSGARSCVSCHTSPYYPFLDDPTKMDEENRKSYKKVKDVTSEYGPQTWGTVEENNGKKSLGTFFEAEKLGPKFGPSKSPLREEVLSKCLPKNYERKNQIAEAMDCEQCHDGETQQFLTFESGLMMNSKPLTTFMNFVKGSNGHHTAIMPPDSDLTGKERDLLFECLYIEAFGRSSQFNYPGPSSKPEENLTNNSLVMEWYKSVPCFNPDKEDECLPTGPSLIDQDIVKLAEIKEIESVEGRTIVLETDSSGADPEGYFSNLNISEYKTKGEVSSYQRPIMGGICTEVCNPSEFTVFTDKDGNFLKIEPVGSRGLQKKGHATLKDKELAVLNQFIKEQLQNAQKKGSLDIKSIVRDVGLENIKNKYEIDAVSGATVVKSNGNQLKLPAELKGAFNTVATTLLYAYDTEKEVKKLKNSSTSNK